MLTSKELFPHIIALLLISSSFATFFYPSPQVSLIEHILVDTHGAHASGFANAITPCTNYVSGVQTLGRETAAQWLRVSFHDFVTARVEEGTGGIDASIGFETLRAENSGSAMNDSLGFFRHWVNSKVSMADLIALSVSVSVGNCGGSQIPVRGGRIDATEAGAPGVPAPETSLEETLEFFGRAGFNQVDSIGLTACGHTMGSVHHGGFPTVVGPEAVTENNTFGGVHFDSTVDVFDTLVVNEYLDGTGNQGGPLVTSFNESSRSDLRLYQSDNNATMIDLANQGKGFLNTCVVLLQRMLETVPRGVVLSDVISPLSVKPINATLDFDEKGILIFTGYIRTLTPTTSSISKSLTFTPSSSKPLSLTPEETPGTSAFGTALFFPFSTKIVNPASFRSFTVAGHGPLQTFPVQSGAFVVSSLTASLTTTSTTTLNFTVAISSKRGSVVSRLLRRDSKPVIRIQAPVGQAGTLGPAIRTFEAVAVSKAGQKAGYDFWAGSVDVGGVATGAASVAVLDGRGEEIDIAFF